MNHPFELAAALGIVPVLSVPREELAEPLAAALREGGLPIIEITMRNECALAALSRIKKAYPDMPAGAGTVLSVEQVQAAHQAGADFIVTPGFNPKVVARCRELGIPVLPGCVTPTEIEAGIEMGLDTFKFFPSEKMGGVETIMQLCGPYRNIRFVPTSGISLGNLREYLSCGKVAAVGGSFMAPAALIQAQNWPGIIALCREAVRVSMGFCLAHVGVNGKNAQEGERMARWLAGAFDLPVTDGERSVFAGDMFECTKTKFPGVAGHIAVGTLSVERAAAYLEAKGIRLREEFKNTDRDGNLVAAYLEEELAGFAIHLIKRG